MCACWEEKEEKLSPGPLPLVGEQFREESLHRFGSSSETGRRGCCGYLHSQTVVPCGPWVVTPFPDPTPLVSKKYSLQHRTKDMASVVGRAQPDRVKMVKPGQDGPRKI